MKLYQYHPTYIPFTLSLIPYTLFCMSAVILYEDEAYRHFLPLVYWRPVFRLRCGRYAFSERISRRLGTEDFGVWVRSELAEVVQARHHWPTNQPVLEGTLLVNGRWIPPGPLQVDCPSAGYIEDQRVYISCDAQLARKLSPEIMLNKGRLDELLEGVPRQAAGGFVFSWPWDLIHHNNTCLHMDWQEQDENLPSPIPTGIHLVQPEKIHLADNCLIKPGVVLDASGGPIYIDSQVTLLPNAVIEGPAYIGPGSIISAGSWIRSGTTIGPGCKVGGEISTTIFHALSNKQHHGFVGHSYIAEWVNLGAGTTTSNMKNTYGTIRPPIGGIPVDSGQQFLGSLIGDFAKSGINQTLTTGSVIGFSSSLTTSTIHSAFVPSFQFITDRGAETYALVRAREVAQLAMQRRQRDLLPAEIACFEQLPAICARLEAV
ncbi:MAG: hypothetical protein HJJLKODD_02014 [Phycisphaerae bacterium]|nr:hypothetical protein [Phycisphaerae bacterium]